MDQNTHAGPYIRISNYIPLVCAKVIHGDEIQQYLKTNHMYVQKPLRTKCKRFVTTHGMGCDDQPAFKTRKRELD